MNSEYIHKNGVKLLAALAAFVMVFAFIGVASSVESDGTDSLATDIEEEVTKITDGAAALEGESYYIDEAIRITGGLAAGTATIYLVGDDAKITATNVGSGTITVYVAFDTDAEGVPISYLDIGATLVNGQTYEKAADNGLQVSSGTGPVTGGPSAGWKVDTEIASALGGVDTYVSTFYVSGSDIVRSAADKYTIIQLNNVDESVRFIQKDGDNSVNVLKITHLNNGTGDQLVVTLAASTQEDPATMSIEQGENIDSANIVVETGMATASSQQGRVSAGVVVSYSGTYEYYATEYTMTAAPAAQTTIVATTGNVSVTTTDATINIVPAASGEATNNITLIVTSEGAVSLNKTAGSVNNITLASGKVTTGEAIAGFASSGIVYQDSADLAVSGKISAPFAVNGVQVLDSSVTVIEGAVTINGKLTIDSNISLQNSISGLGQLVIPAGKTLTDIENGTSGNSFAISSLVELNGKLVVQKKIQISTAWTGDGEIVNEDVLSIESGGSFTGTITNGLRGVVQGTDGDGELTNYYALYTDSINYYYITSGILVVDASDYENGYVKAGNLLEKGAELHVKAIGSEFIFTDVNDKVEINPAKVYGTSVLSGTTLVGASVEIVSAGSDFAVAGAVSISEMSLEVGTIITIGEDSSAIIPKNAAVTFNGGVIIVEGNGKLYVYETPKMGELITEYDSFIEVSGGRAAVIAPGIEENVQTFVNGFTIVKTVVTANTPVKLAEALAQVNKVTLSGNVEIKENDDLADLLNGKTIITGGNTLTISQAVSGLTVDGNVIINAAVSGMTVTNGTVTLGNDGSISGSKITGTVTGTESVSGSVSGSEIIGNVTVSSVSGSTVTGVVTADTVSEVTVDGTVISNGIIINSTADRVSVSKVGDVVKVEGQYTDATIAGTSYTIAKETTLDTTILAVGNSQIQLNNATATTDVVVTSGSVGLTGTLTVAGIIAVAGTDSDIHFTETTVIKAVGSSATITVSKVLVSGNLTLGAGVKVIVEDGKEFKLDDNSTIVAGKDSIQINKGGTLTIGNNVKYEENIFNTTSAGTVDVGTYIEFVNKLPLYDSLRLTGNIEIIKDLEIGEKTIYLNKHELKISADVRLTKTTITEFAEDGNLIGGKVVVSETPASSLTLKKAKIFAAVEDEGENITIAEAITSDWSKDSAQTIMVGYGNTLNMDSVNIVAGQKITIYGIINNKGTTTVNAEASIVIRAGAVLNNSGTMKVFGALNIDNDGFMENAGSIILGNSDGAAQMTVSGKVQLNDGSSLSVKAVKTGAPLNVLDGDGEVIVKEGATLSVNSKIAISSVKLMGTFTINGTSQGTTVTIYDGVSVYVDSVSGTINFTDKDIVNEDVLKDDGVTQKENTIYSDGNEVTLTNVKGITVSEAVDVSSVKLGDDNYKVYKCNMTVSGSVTALKNADGPQVTILSPAYISYGAEGIEYSKTVGAVYIADLTLGERVSLSTTGTLFVTGTLTALEDGSEVIFNKKSTTTLANDKVITNMVTVKGLVVVENNDKIGMVSAAMYEIHNTDADKPSTVYYYTNFVDAVAAAPGAYEKTVTLFGNITVSEDITIEKPIIIMLDSTAEVKISGSANVVVEDGAKMDISSGYVKVTGTLKIVDKDTGIAISSDKNKFVYQVFITDAANEQTVIYAGLVGILKNAEAGQTITMQQSATISEDVEIKAGVTLVVPEKLTLTIGSTTKDITILVNGTIQVQKKANIISVKNTKDIEIVVNGVISSYAGNEFADVKNLEMTDLAKFDIDQKVYYWSNLAYAAENCHEGTITVYGQVTAGDLVFTKDEKATGLTVKVVTVGDGDDVINTVLYASSITLDQAVLDIDVRSKVTGEIIAAALGGDASVEFDGVSNITVESYYDDVKEEDHLYITGAPTGTITIASGNVEVGDYTGDYEFTINGTSVGFDLLIFSKEDQKESRFAEFTIADGADLIVPKNRALVTLNNADESSVFFVEGTLDVKSGEVKLYDAYITGTMNVEGEKTEIIRSTIAGTLDVKEKTETTAEGLATLQYVMIGDEPKSLGAAGTVIGDVKIADNGYIYVFEGSDVSKAKINYNIAEQKNGAKSTVVNINGDDFVTIYANGSVDVYEALAAADIQLIGLETPVFVKESGKEVNAVMYSAPTLKTEDLIENAPSVKVGKYDKVYFDFALVGIYGMISQGQGVILMIDGNTVDNYRIPSTGDYVLSVGTYKVTYEPAYGYEDKGIKITFNGAAVTDGKITVTADMKSFSLTVSDATPADPTPVTPITPTEPSEKDDGMGITEYLLIVLVILAAILVVVVAIRMMRS